MNTKKFLSEILACTVILGSISYNNHISYKNLTVSAVSTGINVTERTPAEIIAYVENHPFSTSAEVVYSSQPSTVSPYYAGTLDDATLNNTLNALNVMRYIAGLDEVYLDNEYNELAQYASLVNAVNGSLSHSPEQPSDMPDDIYQIGYDGASSCNIGLGYFNPAHSVLKGYMYDGDSYNISRVGHRRWCLNPEMKYTGFGQVGRYTAMYAFDSQSTDTSTYGVCWPAQNMPIQYFTSTTPWSISMGYFLDSSSVNVTLTRESDSKTWNFSESASDGEFYVDNGYYGEPGCIIFRPDDISEYSAEDKFTVEIEGLNETVRYTINFFDIENKDIATETTTSSATTTTTTTTTTIFNPDLLQLGDVNYDGSINASDASSTLAEYANLSSGGSHVLNIDITDVNMDGSVNASDASSILAYYAYTSSGGIDSIEKFLGI